MEDRRELQYDGSLNLDVGAIQYLPLYFVHAIYLKEEGLDMRVRAPVIDTSYRQVRKWRRSQYEQLRDHRGYGFESERESLGARYERYRMTEFFLDTHERTDRIKRFVLDAAYGVFSRTISKFNMTSADNAVESTPKDNPKVHDMFKDKFPEVVDKSIEVNSEGLYSNIEAAYSFLMNDIKFSGAFVSPETPCTSILTNNLDVPARTREPCIFDRIQLMDDNKFKYQKISTRIHSLPLSQLSDTNHLGTFQQECNKQWFQMREDDKMSEIDNGPPVDSEHLPETIEKKWQALSRGSSARVSPLYLSVLKRRQHYQRQWTGPDEGHAHLLTTADSSVRRQWSLPLPFLPPFLCQFHATETDAEQSRQKLEIFENSLPNETRWKTLVKNMQSSASCAYDHALEVLKRVENDRVNAKIAFSQVSMEQTPERNRSKRQMLITNALLTDLNAACLSQEDFYNDWKDSRQKGSVDLKPVYRCRKEQIKDKGYYSYTTTNWCPADDRRVHEKTTFDSNFVLLPLQGDVGHYEDFSPDSKEDIWAPYRSTILCEEFLPRFASSVKHLQDRLDLAIERHTYNTTQMFEVGLSNGFQKTDKINLYFYLMSKRTILNELRTRALIYKMYHSALEFCKLLTPRGSQPSSNVLRIVLNLVFGKNDPLPAEMIDGNETEINLLKSEYKESIEAVPKLLEKLQRKRSKNVSRSVRPARTRPIEQR